MIGRKKKTGAHLIPDVPPARLPEEDLLARLSRDKHYRRSASLLHALLYRPRRLLVSGGKGSRISAPLRRALGRRLVAMATSLALLIGMASFAPLNPFSIVRSARADNTSGEEDYSWLLDEYNDGTSPERAYRISTPVQLSTLAKLVDELSTPTSTTTFPYDGHNYVIGPGQVSNYLNSSFLIKPLPDGENLKDADDSPLPTESVTPTPSESVTPVPSESKMPDPSESKTPEPAESPSPSPSTEPTTEPAPEITQEPAPLPSHDSKEEPATGFSLLASIFAFFTGGGDSSPTQASTPIDPSSPTSPETPASSESVSPFPSETPAPSATVSPSPSESPAPSEAVSPSPSESPAPSSTVSPSPSKSPAPSEAVSPSPSESPAPTPTPSDSAKGMTAGNSEALLADAQGALTYTIHIPIGMADRFFKLEADLNLNNYNGISSGGPSLYWTPIGTLTSFDANGKPSGTPFLGTFDGGGHTIIAFQYAPNPARITGGSMSGYGLFGYVGTGGTVKDLNFKMTRPDGNTALPWVVSNPLGGQTFAVGVVAAASSGVISGCTVTQAELSYSIASNGSAVSSVGGIAGLLYVSDSTTNIDSCVFLGKISNTLADTSNIAALANQRVGGIAGAILTVSVTSTALSNCAAGVDIDIHNGPTIGAAGGVGGLVGYCGTTQPLTKYPTVTRSFTTGVINSKHDAGGLVGRTDAQMAWTDSFSTAALGITTRNAPSVDLKLNIAESIGGLIGNNQAVTTLTNVYFAGGLLAPQFGSIVGQQGSSLTLSNIAVDGTQTPHSAAKYAAKAPIGTVLRDLSDASVFVTSGMSSTWAAPKDPYLPQLNWAADSTSQVVTTLSQVAKDLSQAAATRWVTPNSSNAIKGSDGTYSLYRLKDDAGAAPNTLGTLPLGTPYTANNVIVGGIYTSRTIKVSNTTVPIARWAVTAANQTEGSANVIDTSANLLRFLDRANLAGGGYLGADFTLSGNISGTVIPVYGGSSTPFCGSLTGDPGSVLSKLKYQKNATGLFNTTLTAEFEDLSFQDITIDSDLPLGSSDSPYFGLLAGRMATSSLNNVDVTGFSYTFQDPKSAYYHNNIIAIGLVGTIPSESVSATYTNCDVTGLAVNIKARTNNDSRLRVYVGGLLGSNSSNNTITITDCTASGAISAALSSDSNSGSLSYVGGFIGYDTINNSGISITNGRVFANLVGGTVGGLIGRGAPAAITNSLFTGSVNTTDFSTNTTPTTAAAGGLVGYNTKTLTITECAVFGNITSRYYAGGLIGYSNSLITIRSSYASAIVTAKAAGGAAGGLVGSTTRISAELNTALIYFVGQVWAPGPYGVFAGQTTENRYSAFGKSLYDSTLTQRGIPVVGSYVTAPSGGVGAKPGDGVNPEDAWETLVLPKNVTWSYTAGERSYPQLKWMKNPYAVTGVNRATDDAVKEISRVSTYQLFDKPSDITSLYSMKENPPFTVTNPGEISSAAADSTFLSSSVDGTTTTYTIMNETEKDEGFLNFTYSNVRVNGSPLSLPYTIAKERFKWGDGTLEKPFIIYDLDQLKIFRSFVNSGKNAAGIYYQISEAPENSNDNFKDLAPTVIDMSPIENWQGTTSSLAGYLDGHHSTLENLTTSGWLNSQGTWSAGLLGGLGDGSSVKDLNITGATITDTVGRAATSAAGILSATARGATVTNVRVEGTISEGRNVAVGGLIGSSFGPLSLTNCFTDVAITALGGDGNDAIGAGGLVGSMSGGSNAAASISECATQGSIEDWGGVGGLVGYLNGSAFTLTAINSYSLINFSDTGDSSSVHAGGLLGRVVNVNGSNKNSYIKLDSCYYAGENNLSSAITRLRGGFVGGATSSNSSVNGFGNLYILNCAYNTDGTDVTARANLSDGTEFHPAESWDGVSGKAFSGLARTGDTPAFQMSQVSPPGVMAGWDKGIWIFEDGFYPHLEKDSTWAKPATKLAHLAIHYTKAADYTKIEKPKIPIFSNVFIRAEGAAISPSVGTGAVRVTDNRRMAVATCPGVGSPVSLTVTLDGATRTVKFNPSTDSSGNRDASIYYVNPDGMWANKVWTVYTADALAGLSTMFSADTADQNGLPKPDLSTLSGSEIRLGKDIDLGASYSGMGNYDTWRPIGSNSIPFNTTFNGDGKTLYNLAVNPFYYATDLTDASLGLFGTVGTGGTVKNLNLAAKSTADGAPFYQQPGVRVAQGVSAAGALTAVLAGGRLENCLVSIPVYTLADTPAYNGYASDWSAVPNLGASSTASLGGLAGRVTADSSITNCAYTGYVYADPKTPRPGSGSSALEHQTTGPVGGLVGSVAVGKSLTVTRSYAASYVGGTTAGALVGDAAGELRLDGVYYDANALPGDVSPLGSGLITGGAATNAVPAELGEGWESDTPDGLYPLQSALLDAADTLSARMRVSLSPNAGSATSGTLLYSGGTLAYSATQPGVSLTPGTAAVTSNTTFVKTIDGLTQLELKQQQTGAARRFLISLRCWYDDMKLVDGVRHYTISTAEELWELGQIVSGTIGDSGVSKVAHTHAPSGGYDDFTGAVIRLAADIDLTKLTDQVNGTTAQRPWSPIGTEAHPFHGTFEGGGHLVFGMYSDPAAGTQGLFGTVSGTVQNLLVSGASLRLPAGGTGGILAARLTGTGSLLFCGVSGSVAAEAAGVIAGGLAGSSAGTVTGSFSTAELTAAGALSSGTLGGLVGSLSGGALTQSYFTGFINAPYVSAVGGIAAEQTGGAVSHCYVSAYLDGAVVYRISKIPGEDCRYDGRHLSKGTGGTRQDAAALAMSGTGWTPGDGMYYPFPARFSPDSGTPDLSGTPLGTAAKLAAAIFTFGGGTGGGNYARFQTVTAPALTAGGYVLRSGNAALLTVSDGQARPVEDSNGEAALRLCLGSATPPPFQRPCWLSIPSALAVSYRFNWEELIYRSGYTPNANYNISVTTGGSAYRIRNSTDWNSFVSLANSGNTAGKVFVLDHDIDFGGAAILTVTAAFSGSFQGGGHTLSNFKVSAPLFSSVAQGGKVEFLALSNGSLSVSNDSAPLVIGLVAGSNAGRIANVAADSCSVSVSRSVTKDLSTIIGGLVGHNSGTLDSSYFYTPTITDRYSSQVTAYYPDNAKPTKHYLGGLTGVNTGNITGCYAAFTPLCYFGSLFSGNTAYYSALAGLNDGGAIRYSYWRFAYDYSSTITLTAYKNSDGSVVEGTSLYAGATDPELTALWLSADSYGGSYYVADGRLKLYSFRLVKYDLWPVFGEDTKQHYLMLALQFGTGENAMSSNAICSWKDYLLPNFSNLPKTSFLTVRIPVLSPTLTYNLTQARILRKGMAELSTPDLAISSGSANGGYSVTGLGDNSTRVLLDLQLSSASESVPWGVYRRDSTLSKSNP